MPPNVLHTDGYVQECHTVVNDLCALGHNVSVDVFRGTKKLLPYYIVLLRILLYH